MSLSLILRKAGTAVKAWLARFSFRTGVIVLVMCIPFYVMSFAQMLLPISTSLKGALWVIFFGLAKTAQYGGLTILGSEGIKRIKAYRQKNRNNQQKATKT